MHAQQNRLYSDVEFLTTIRPFRNCVNIESLTKVCEYLRTEFKNIDLEIQDQKWMVGPNEYTNVIASYNSHKTKRLIVGAHYDVCGNQEGADDNASAVAGLLETARLIAENKPELDYGIYFVAYCLEEPPFFATEYMGSYIHAKSLHDNNVDVIGMICYEMIGYFSDKPNSQPFPTPELAELYPSVGNFIIVVGTEKYALFSKQIHQLMCENAKIGVEIINLPQTHALSGMSDHRNYWKFGYNALMINDTAFLRNPNYHQQSDTIETLDFPRMTEVINCAYHAIIKFGSVNHFF